MIETVHEVLKHCGTKKNITKFLQGYTFESGFYVMMKVPELSFRSDRSDSFKESFWDQYSGLKPWEYVSASHANGFSLQHVVNTCGNDRQKNSLTPLALMRACLSSLHVNADIRLPADISPVKYAGQVKVMCGLVAGER